MDPQFLIRSAREDDLEGLFELSQQVYFINLPEDREVIRKKIELSIASFNGDIEDRHKREYIFVLESLEDHKLIGSSMIIARHGSLQEPHMYLELREIKKYSETIHSGIIHNVLRLRFDEDGPTEIGGLVLSPSYRNNEVRLGRQLSYSRFLFIKMKRRLFKDRILSELMPPLSDSGESVLWEALGRKFTNLSYQEADKLSRKNKEFVTSLFPKGDIYTCLLSGEARDAIGKVGTATEPVKYMLEKIGFKWKQHIDPFDGGPHYYAETDKVSIVRDTGKFKVAREPLKRKSKEVRLCGYFLKSEFFCVQTQVEFARGSIYLSKAAQEALRVTPGDMVYAMPVS